MAKKKYDQTKEEHVRKQGFIRGLRAAHTLLRKAKNVQARNERNTNGQKDPDKKDNHDFAANVLHDLCLRLQDQIDKARV